MSVKLLEPVPTQMWVAIWPVQSSLTHDRMMKPIQVQEVFLLLGHSMNPQKLPTLQWALKHWRPLTSAPYTEPTVSMHNPHLVLLWYMVVCLIMHWGLSASRLPYLGVAEAYVTEWTGWTAVCPHALRQSALSPLLGWLAVGEHQCKHKTVIQLKRVRFFHAVFSGIAELFRVSFNGPSRCLQLCLEPRTGCFWCLHFHSSCGMATTEDKVPSGISKWFKCKDYTVWTHSHVFYKQILLIATAWWLGL